MKIIALPVIISMITACGQNGAPDEPYRSDLYHTTALTPVLIYPLTHASMCIEFKDHVIQIDPVSKMGDKVINYSQFPEADFVIITHEHYDHFDTAAIQAVSTEETQVITNQRCADMLGYGTVMANGDTLVVNEWLTIEAVPAYNTTEGHLQFHPKGRDNGYILNIEGLRIYIAGDTEDIPEMADLKDIDVAFLPCNQPYTMTVEQLVRCARTIKPFISLYPYHYGNTDVSVIPDMLKDDDIEVLIRDFQ